jgi:hypothetical protein
MHPKAGRFAVDRAFCVTEIAGQGAVNSPTLK